MKALSNVVTAVIFIVLAITIGSIITAYTTKFFQEETAGITNRTGEVVDCTTSRIEIIDVYLNFEDNASRVFVRNAGFIDEEIVLAEMLNQQSEQAAILTQLPVGVMKGQIRRLDFNVTDVMQQCADFSEISVVTNCNSVSFAEAPKC